MGLLCHLPEQNWAPLLQNISALSNIDEQTKKPKPELPVLEQDKITSRNRFRPPTTEEEYQTNRTDSSLESLQTLNQRYQEERMATATTRKNQNIPNPKEIRINLPKEFSGSQSEAGPFLQDVTLYLTLNQEIYNNDLEGILHYTQDWCKCKYEPKDMGGKQASIGKCIPDPWHP